MYSVNEGKNNLNTLLTIKMPYLFSRQEIKNLPNNSQNYSNNSFFSLAKETILDFWNPDRRLIKKFCSQGTLWEVISQNFTNTVKQQNNFVKNILKLQLSNPTPTLEYSPFEP